MLASQSTGRDAGGSSFSMRSSSASPLLISLSSSDMRSGPVLGVDGNVFVRQVAGPHGRRGLAAFEHDADRDLALAHHALAVFLAVARGATAGLRHLHVVQVQIDAADVEVF